MNSKAHREPTPEELKKHKEQHPKTLKAIVEAQRKTAQNAKVNYGRDGRVARYD